MNIKETFLKLTEFTTPFKSETDFESLLSSLIPELKKDGIGNYHKVIGDSDTVFTCHLDNYCKEKEKVNHIFEDNIIKTDGTTILGADNKAGVCVLLYLIENNVPGHYCFFVGEEPILSGGLYGSSLFAEYYGELFANKKRAIAFDRKHYGSIISRQSAQPCCSDEFVDVLVELFTQQNVEMENDSTGYYTDTSAFMEIIPECTNISVGVWDEHKNSEYVDIEYVETIAKAAALINWEILPAVREPKYWLDEIPVELDTVTTEFDEAVFMVVRSCLGEYNFHCMNRTAFQTGKEMTFNHWFREFPLTVIVNEGIGIINNKYIVNIDFSNEETPVNEDEFKDIILSIREERVKSKI